MENEKNIKYASRHCGRGPAIQAVKKENIFINRLDCGHPAGRPSGMTTKKAFTLTELLVVVLIIGLLTAIAMPMYEKASRKAEFVQVQMDLKYLMDTIDAYTMENGYNANYSFNELIDYPGLSCTAGNWQTGVICTNNYGTYYLLTGPTAAIEWAPNVSRFVTSSSTLYVFAKAIGQPWKWKETNIRHHNPALPSKNETTQMVCDWWVKMGGRPTDSNIAALCS